MRYLLDSTVLIDHANADAPAAELLERLFSEGHELYTCDVIPRLHDGPASLDGSAIWLPAGECRGMLSSAEWLTSSAPRGHAQPPRL